MLAQARSSDRRTATQLMREARRDALRAIVAPPLPAARVVSEIVGFADDDATRRDLAERYRELLRDEGREPEIAAFDRAWNARSPESGSAGPAR